MTTALAEAAKVLFGASVWPRYPALYEINTWVWLSELSWKYGKNIDLSSVPSAEWDAIAAYGFDAVWFMGVWERSPAGTAIANRNESLLSDFRRALPDFRPGDNVGSPYCVRRYVVDKRLGGPEGLAVARRELSQRGLNLMLDLCRTMWRRTIPGSPSILGTSYEAMQTASGMIPPRTCKWGVQCTPADETRTSPLGRMFSN